MSLVLWLSSPVNDSDVASPAAARSRLVLTGLTLEEKAKVCNISLNPSSVGFSASAFPGASLSVSESDLCTLSSRPGLGSRERSCS